MLNSRLGPAIFVLAACFPACSSTPAPNPGGGGSATAGSAGGGGTPSSGAGGQLAGGSATGGGGSATAGATNGGAGATAGGSAGASGAGGAGGTGGEAAGGMTFWGPGGPKKQWECPAGPFPAQQEGQSTDVCDDFNFDHGYNEGPTWIKSESAFFFTNFIQGSNEQGDIIKYTLGGSCEKWLDNVGCNGLGVSPSGKLLAACHGPRAVVEYDLQTKEPRMVATMVNGELLDSPNDLIARSDGNVYFSNTTYELGNRPEGIGFGLMRIDPMGMTSLIEGGQLNGIALSPDETKLHVVQKGTWTLDAMGNASNKGQPTPSGDGIAVDCAGGISNRGTNSAYGGPDGKTLIVVGPGTNVRTIAMTVPGLP
jgi:gluconolactonase